MSDSLLYKLRSGKPSKAFFFLKGYLKRCIPDCFFSMRRKSCLEQVEMRSDKDYIYERVNYYNKLQHPVILPEQVLHEHKHSYYVYLDKIRNFRPSTFHKAYYFDLKDVTCWFNQNLRISYIPGDVYLTQPKIRKTIEEKMIKPFPLLLFVTILSNKQIHLAYTNRRTNSSRSPYSKSITGISINV